jgi:hypothetical protein
MRSRNTAQRRREDLERRHHLPLLLAVNEVVMVLHRDERREVVCDGIIWVGREWLLLVITERLTLHLMD